MLDLLDFDVFDLACEMTGYSYVMKFSVTDVCCVSCFLMFIYNQSHCKPGRERGSNGSAAARSLSRVTRAREA